MALLSSLLADLKRRRRPLSLSYQEEKHFIPRIVVLIKIPLSRSVSDSSLSDFNYCFLVALNFSVRLCPPLRGSLGASPIEETEKFLGFFRRSPSSLALEEIGAKARFSPEPSIDASWHEFDIRCLDGRRKKVKLVAPARLPGRRGLLLRLGHFYVGAILQLG